MSRNISFPVSAMLAGRKEASAETPFRITAKATSGNGRAYRPRKVETVQLRSSALEKWNPAGVEETLALIDVWTVTKAAEAAAFPETDGRPPAGGCRVKVQLADLAPGSRGFAEKLARVLAGRW